VRSRRKAVGLRAQLGLLRLEVADTFLQGGVGLLEQQVLGFAGAQPVSRSGEEHRGLW